MTKAWMIIDLQFGSTGKGALAGYLAHRRQPDCVVAAWSPNAGHTFIDKSGRKFVHRVLPNGIVSPKLERVMIGPGAVFDAHQLALEIEQCADLLMDHEILVHKAACVVRPEHLEHEAKHLRHNASTRKGAGAAAAERMSRPVLGESNTAGDLDHQLVVDGLGARFLEMRRWALRCGVKVRVVDTTEWLSHIEESTDIQIEGAQGYSLSLYHGFYPFVTYRDVSTAQILADCGVPHTIPLEVIGTLRTFPIRVSNREGYSGPCYPDQRELTWEELGREPELTTVTKLPRRIFTFSMEQFTEAAKLVRPDSLFLSFADYLTDDVTIRLGIPDLYELLGQLSVHVHWAGYGPRESDIKELP